MKILVIEDEVKLAEYLKKGLGEAGHNVDIVHNGVDGLHMALEGGYDLLILDGMLPGIDGFTLLTAFRKTKQTPVLMLTARVSVEESSGGTPRVVRCSLTASVEITGSLSHRGDGGHGASQGLEVGGIHHIDEGLPDRGDVVGCGRDQQVGLPAEKGGDL